MANSNIGRWAFIIAAILAILASFVNLGTAVVWVLAVLGLVVGFLNVTEKESQGFLIATIALIVAVRALSPLFGDFAGGTTVKLILDNIALVASPASLVVAVRHIWSAARD